MDTKFFKLMGVLQLLIAFINFYVAMDVVHSSLAMFNIAIAAVCTMAGVFCTVAGAKLMGALD